MSWECFLCLVGEKGCERIKEKGSLCVKFETKRMDGGGYKQWGLVGKLLVKDQAPRNMGS